MLTFCIVELRLIAEYNIAQCYKCFSFTLVMDKKRRYSEEYLKFGFTSIISKGVEKSQCGLQRWSRGHKARGQGQGHKKNPRPRPRTAFPRTDTLEAKDRNARGQGPRTQALVLSKKKSSQKFFKRSPQKNVFQKIFQALHKILTIQKIVLSSSRGQANFRGLEASRPRPRT